jgi:hypothetical protein
MPICYCFIGKRPETFSWLEFGRVWREKHEMDTLRDRKPLAAMPPGPIHDQNHMPICASPNSLGKLRESDGKNFHIHCW